jgi:WD40 repeat protein
METIIPQAQTIEYLSQMKLRDIFPQSINSLNINNKNQNKIESENNNSNCNNNIDNNNINTSEMCTQTMNDMQSTSNYKLEKHLKDKIKLNQNNTINCIYSYNNILLIAINNELKLYDISGNFELYGSIKMPGYDKNILCLACTEINNILYGVIGGEFSSIHVIDILSIQELTGYQLIGHKNKVYQLEFHPYNNNLLLSASKDCTVRLWNFKCPELLVIFGGPNSFESDVLCIDWDNEGEFFVGSGVDCVVRIYKIDELIQNCIDLSMEKKKVKTLLKSLPYFSCNDVHDNAIDCIKYNNKFIISKSVDGIIKEWLPFKDSNGQNSFFLINIFVFNTKQLIVGIKFCFAEDNIIVGNEMGQIFLFNKKETELNKEVNNHHFFQNNFTQMVSVDDKNEDILIKNINYNSFYDLLFFGGNNGDVYIYKLINDSNK